MLPCATVSDKCKENCKRQATGSVVSSHKSCTSLSCTLKPQDIGPSDLGHASRLLPQLTQLTFGHGYHDERINLGVLRGVHGR